MSSVSLKKPAAAKKPAAKKPAKLPSTPFASVDDIRLGMVVRDPGTGLTGIASLKAELMSGSIQYAVQPEGDGKTMPEAMFCDDFLLEYVGIGVSKRTPTPDENATFRLGEELKDTVTGFQGIAIDRTTYLNGCVHYTVQPQKQKLGFLAKLLGEPPRGTHFDYKRLRKVSDGVAKPKPRPVPVAAVVPAAKPAKDIGFTRSRTGGPTRSAASFRHG
jgi:hypothetical protein